MLIYVVTESDSGRVISAHYSEWMAIFAAQDESDRTTVSQINTKNLSEDLQAAIREAVKEDKRIASAKAKKRRAKP